MAGMDLVKLRAQLIEHEGLRLKPYRCTAGKLTIGVGRNLEARGITQAEAMMMLEGDIQECALDCVTILGRETWDRLSDARQRVMVDMRFNLGPAGLRGFITTLSHIRAGKYSDAAQEMLDSRWAKQVGGRAERLAQMMREG